MTTTGKKARRQFGTRAAAKRAKGRHARKTFGSLPVSVVKGNALAFVNMHSSTTPESRSRAS